FVFEQSTKDALGFSTLVRVRGVEHANASIERTLHDAASFVFRGTLSEVHRANRERRELACLQPEMISRHRKTLYQTIVLPWVSVAPLRNTAAHDIDVSRSELIADGSHVHMHIEMASHNLTSGDALPLRGSGGGENTAPETVPSHLVMNETEVTLGT